MSVIQNKISKDAIIKLEEYINKFMTVKFIGGREVTGVLKSCDGHLNLILDDSIERLRGSFSIAFIYNIYFFLYIFMLIYNNNNTFSLQK